MDMDIQTRQPFSVTLFSPTIYVYLKLQLYWFLLSHSSPAKNVLVNRHETLRKMELVDLFVLFSRQFGCCCMVSNARRMAARGGLPLVDGYGQHRTPQAVEIALLFCSLLVNSDGEGDWSTVEAASTLSLCLP